MKTALTDEQAGLSPNLRLTFQFWSSFEAYLFIMMQRYTFRSSFRHEALFIVLFRRNPINNEHKILSAMAAIVKGVSQFLTKRRQI